LAEPPERAILRSVLMELKAKTLASEKSLLVESAGFIDRFVEFMHLVEQQSKVKSESSEMLKKLGSLLDTIFSLLLLFSRNLLVTLKDYEIYIKALESSFKEYDDTFEKQVYEPARKQAEAMIKEQEELSKRAKPRKLYDQ